jgi:hypothetical protein
VPLFDLKFVKRICRVRCGNFKSAAPVPNGPILLDACDSRVKGRQAKWMVVKQRATIGKRESESTAGACRRNGKISGGARRFSQKRSGDFQIVDKAHIFARLVLAHPVQEVGRAVDRHQRERSNGADDRLHGQKHCLGASRKFDEAVFQVE